MKAMKTPSSNKSKATVSVIVSEEFYRELKVRAALEEKSLSGFLEQLLRIGLQEYEKRRSKGIPASALGELIGAVSYEGDAVRDAEEIYD